MTLTEFLLARLAEREASARATSPHDDPDMEPEQFFEALDLWDGQLHTRRCGWRMGEGLAKGCECDTPARVLAECERDRRIVERHDGDDSSSFGEPCPTLRLLALPYAGHPSYDEAWRPER